ncbi:hypothetical protein DFH06DRAFT_1339066 [Mycena polygramma]|nr:hypothetical protein DFH06DRAFT_1339066 [Mycena polygramma]
MVRAQTPFISPHDASSDTPVAMCASDRVDANYDRGIVPADLAGYRQPPPRRRRAFAANKRSSSACGMRQVLAVGGAAPRAWDARYAPPPSVSVSSPPSVPSRAAHRRPATDRRERPLSQRAATSPWVGDAVLRALPPCSSRVPDSGSGADTACALRARDGARALQPNPLRRADSAPAHPLRVYLKEKARRVRVRAARPEPVPPRVEVDRAEAPVTSRQVLRYRAPLRTGRARVSRAQGSIPARYVQALRASRRCCDRGEWGVKAEAHTSWALDTRSLRPPISSRGT